MVRSSLLLTTTFGLFHLANLYSQPGILDNTFGVGGLTTTEFAGGDDWGNAIAIQSDGKIVVVGNTHNGVNSDFGMTRYNTDGSLDNTFGIGGKVITDFANGNDAANSVIIQTDGKIILIGQATITTYYDFALARYNLNGTLDTTFGVNGITTTSIGSGNDFGNAGSIQPDGSIVVAGTIDYGSGSRIALTRYNSNGILDSTFDLDGIMIAPQIQKQAFAYSLKLQTDNKIVVAGSADTAIFSLFYFDILSLRVNTNGNLDSSYGSNGISLIDLNDYEEARDLIIQTDGKIILAGYGRPSIDEDFTIVRLMPNGQLDATYGIGGISVTDVASSDDEIYSMCLQPDGKIIVGGRSNNGSNFDFALARFQINGNIDSTFGINGMVTTDILMANDYGYGLALQTDGKIVFAGTTNPGSDADFAVARYFSGLVGQSQFDIPEQLHIYPNPAQDLVFIESAGCLEGSTIQLLNAQGEVVYKNEGSSTTSYSINISTLSTGVYYLSIFQGGRYYSTKLIKN